MGDLSYLIQKTLLSIPESPTLKTNFLISLSRNRRAGFAIVRTTALFISMFAHRCSRRYKRFDNHMLACTSSQFTFSDIFRVFRTPTEFFFKIIWFSSVTKTCKIVTIHGKIDVLPFDTIQNEKKTYNILSPLYVSKNVTQINLARTQTTHHPTWVRQKTLTFSTISLYMSLINR